MSWSLSRQRVFGWAFLLGISIFYAALNLGFLGILLAPLGSLVNLEPTPGDAGPPSWVMVLGWFMISLVYVPAYWVLGFSTKRFGWSLREWGFGFSFRSWVAIGFSILLTLLAWLPASLSSRFGGLPTDFVGLRDAFNEVGVPMLLFLGYARIAEELIYRGFALVFLRRFLPSSRYRTILAVLVSSALFCLVHTHKSPGENVSMFFGGAIPLAAFTVWSRSLSFALVVHGAIGGGHVGALLALGLFFILALVGRRSS